MGGRLLDDREFLIDLVPCCTVAKGRRGARESIGVHAHTSLDPSSLMVDGLAASAYIHNRGWRETD